MVEDEDEDEDVVDYAVLADTPPIHLRQTEVNRLSNGMSLEERNYRMWVSMCESQGVSRVPDEDVSKLGRIYYEAWYQGLRMAARSDSWNFDMTGCNFQVVRESELTIQTPDGAWDIDLIKQEGSFEPESRTKRYPSQPDEPENVDVSSEFITIKRGGIISVAGQPCSLSTARVAAGIITSCVWTEGARWGLASSGPFDTGGVDGYTSGFPLLHEVRTEAIFEDEIYISSLTTDSITVGTPFDQSVFSVPAGIKRVPGYTGEDDESTVEQDDSDEDE